MEATVPEAEEHRTVDLLVLRTQRVCGNSPAVLVPGPGVEEGQDLRPEGWGCHGDPRMGGIMKRN